MGTVFKGVHESLERPVALKILHEHLTRDPEIAARFHNEARLMARLQHPNIVQLYDFKEETARLVLVMEFVEGETLAHLIGREIGPIPHERALPMFRQILSGVTYAHSKGVIHRDLKPSNILVNREGCPKITDFGIAKIAGQHGMTRTGTKLGTLYYMSPEQVRGTKDVDQRSDIYSLGMTLYEMLAGRLPFDEDHDTSEYAVMDAIVRRDLPDPRTFYPHIPERLVDIIGRATTKEPGARFQDCGQFIETLAERKSDFAHLPTSVVESLPLLVEPLQDVPGPARTSHAVQIQSPALRRDRFSRDPSGVVTDHITGFQWRVGPDRSTNWKAARKWVLGLGNTWRMPSRSELRELYDAGIRYGEWGPFENSGIFVWSCEERDSVSVWGYRFIFGSEYWSYSDVGYDLRVFAVRSRG